MKKQTFDFLRNKGSTVKEINVSFTQYQDKTQNTSKKNNNDNGDPQGNQTLAQVEISFWKKNISQLEEQYESLKSFDIFKEKQLSLLKCQADINNSNNPIEKQKKENELKLKNLNNKYEEIESKLDNEINLLNEMQKEISEHNSKKNKIKDEINKLKNIVQKAENEKKNKKSAINFNKIDFNEINKPYKGLMTTTHGEMCRSRLGNKLLLSLNMEEINKHQVFDKKNLAYPVLKRKKIQFSYLGEGFNTKKLGKKKINLNDFNNFKVAGLPDGVQTVY